jgi:hypothetical protein
MEYSLDDIVKGLLIESVLTGKTFCEKDNPDNRIITEIKNSLIFFILFKFV